MILINNKGKPLTYYGFPYSYNTCPCETCPCDNISCDISMVHLLNVWYPGTVNWESEDDPVYWCTVHGFAVPLTNGVDTSTIAYASSKIYYYGSLEKDESTGRWLTTFYSWNEIQDGTAVLPSGKTWHCLKPKTEAVSLFGYRNNNNNNTIAVRMKAEFSNVKTKMRLDIENIEETTECYFNSLEITLNVTEDGETDVSSVRYQNITDKPVMSEEAVVLKGAPFPWNVSTFNYSGKTNHLESPYILPSQTLDTTLRQIDAPDWYDITSYFKNYQGEGSGVVSAQLYYGVFYNAENGMSISNFNADAECAYGLRFGYLADGTRCSDCSTTEYSYIAITSDDETTGNIKLSTSDIVQSTAQEPEPDPAEQETPVAVEVSAPAPDPADV